MFDTPILLIAFNRPDTTKKLLDAIRNIKPTKLYIATDGPRLNNQSDIIKTQNVNSIFKKIDWNCDTFFLKRNKNLGCKLAVSKAIDWFFENEECGIILEDDCLPNYDFFIYCQTLLKKFSNNKEIFMITGDNFQQGKIHGNYSYYFSKLTHVWGWATWKRAWAHYDVDMSFWPEFKNSSKFKNIFKSFTARRYFKSIFNEVYNGKIDTWDYQWTACVWFNNGLSITPNCNLVINIGFGPDATHTKSKNNYNPYKTNKILPITHPKEIKRNYDADLFVFNNSLNGNEMTILKILKRKIKSMILKIVS